MNIVTHETTIKIHTFQLDDHDIIRLMENRDELDDLLSSLLTAKHQSTNGDHPAGKPAPKTKRGGARKHSKIECRYCGRSVAQGWINKHESACPQRPPAA